MGSLQRLWRYLEGKAKTETGHCWHVPAASVRINMDGRGRALDNIFIERLWRTVKYEDIYLKDYQTVRALHTGLERYFRFYNEERPHQNLDDHTPAGVYARQATIV